MEYCWDWSRYVGTMRDARRVYPGVEVAFAAFIFCSLPFSSCLADTGAWSFYQDVGVCSFFILLRHFFALIFFIQECITSIDSFYCSQNMYLYSAEVCQNLYATINAPVQRRCPMLMIVTTQSMPQNDQNVLSDITPS